MSSIIKRFFSVFFVMLLLSLSSSANAESTGDATADVICNIIGYVWKIGGPLMTVVIIGAALLAIFGRMPWPALFALGMFCGVFFGAKSIIIKVVPDTNETRDMLNKCATQ